MGNEVTYQKAAIETKQNKMKITKCITQSYEWNNQKDINKWCKQDVKDYVKSLTYTECTKKVMRNQVNGKKISTAQTPKELSKIIGIPIEKAEGLFEILCQQKQREVMKKMQKFKKKEIPNNQKQIPNAICNPTDDGEDDCDQEACIIDEKGKDINDDLYFQPSNSYKTRPTIHWTVFNLKSWFITEFGNSIKPNQKKKVLVAMDETLLNGSRMANIDDVSMFCAVLNVDEKLGKMIFYSYKKKIKSEFDDEKSGDKSALMLQDKKELYRVRKLPWRKYKWIRLSKETDCLFGYTDEDNIDRAEMSCKHAIASETMFMFIKHIIEKDREVIKIICPVENCDEEWDWNSCLKIADMTNEEMVKYNVIKSNRMSKAQFKECPSCQVKTMKPKTVNQFRVKCIGCNSYDWCFTCQQKWKGGGLILCGNENCDAVSSVNEILQKCKLKDLKYVKNGKIPEFRACPTCLQLIEHKDACKHMKCGGRDCKTEFCFLCLAIRDPKTGWPISCKGWSKKSDTSETAGYNVTCKLAGRQYFK